MNPSYERKVAGSYGYHRTSPVIGSERTCDDVERIRT